MSWFLIRWPDYWENWKQDISKIEKKVPLRYCGPWLLKLLHYLGLIYVEWSHFQNWILQSLSFKIRYTISRQLPQWYSLLDCVCPIWNSINPVDIILGIVGRDEKISQVKKIMEIQHKGDSSKNETSLQVRNMPLEVLQTRISKSQRSLSWNVWSKVVQHATLGCKMFGPFWSVWCKITLAEVGVSLPWWCHALVLLAPGYWKLFINLIIFS